MSGAAAVIPESEAAARDLPVPGGVNGVNLPARGPRVNLQFSVASRLLVRPMSSGGCLAWSPARATGDAADPMLQRLTRDGALAASRGG